MNQKIHKAVTALINAVVEDANLLNGGALLRAQEELTKSNARCTNYVLALAAVCGELQESLKEIVSMRETMQRLTERNHAMNGAPDLRKERNEALNEALNKARELLATNMLLEQEIDNNKVLFDNAVRTIRDMERRQPYKIMHDDLAKMVACGAVTIKAVGAGILCEHVTSSGAHGAEAHNMYDAVRKAADALAK